MARRSARASTNVYRQLDRAVTAALGQPVDATITAVAIDPDVVNGVIVYFNAPMLVTSFAIVSTHIDFNGRTNVDAGAFSPDGRSVKFTLDGSVSAEDPWTNTANTFEAGPWRTISGGGLNAGSGAITNVQAPGFFNLLSATQITGTRVDLEFDAPVAGWFGDSAHGKLDFTGIAVGSGTSWSVVESSDENTKLRIDATGDASASGQTWTIEANARGFVSLQGLRLAPGTGTIAGS